MEKNILLLSKNDSSFILQPAVFDTETEEYTVTGATINRQKGSVNVNFTTADDNSTLISIRADGIPGNAIVNPLPIGEVGILTDDGVQFITNLNDFLNATESFFFRKLSGGGGAAGWSFNGDAITAGQFLGTTNTEPLVLKQNGSQVFKYSNSENIATGKGANASFGTYAIATGHNSSATNSASIAIGWLASSTGSAGVAVGMQAACSGANGVAIGMLANQTHIGGVLINQGNGVAASSEQLYQFKAVMNGGFKLLKEEGGTSFEAGIGNIAAAVNSTTGLFYPPRMTAAQALAVDMKNTAGMCYITDTDGEFTPGLYYWDGSQYRKIQAV